MPGPMIFVVFSGAAGSSRTSGRPRFLVGNRSAAEPLPDRSVMARPPCRLPAQGWSNRRRPSIALRVSARDARWLRPRRRQAGLRPPAPAAIVRSGGGGMAAREASVGTTGPDRVAAERQHVVVMGASGCGKSTVGERAGGARSAGPSTRATATTCPASVAKMSARRPARRTPTAGRGWRSWRALIGGREAEGRLVGPRLLGAEAGLSRRVAHWGRRGCGSCTCTGSQAR